MGFLQFEGVGVSGMSACVPRRIIHNYEYTEFFSQAEVKEVVDKIGIVERRFVDDKTCSSDLCFAAAERLISDMNIDKSEIDMLIFISQTPDYRMPATSVILQERLGLSHKTIAFDISLGCSAFIYGLTVAYSYAQQPNIRKVLLLDGETRSKVYSPKDRKTAFLFGDGGVAAIIEKGEKYGKSFFSLNSDGSRESLIKINAGGYRIPSSSETVKEKVVDEYGNIRTDEQGYMKGGDVFNFVIREIPNDIKATLEFAEMNIQAIDYYIFHQANNFMNSYLVSKLKIDVNKVPSTISKFGNVSSVSVPLTIVSELKDKLIGNHTILLSAFGVGMTWATGIVSMSDCYISDIVEI
ncbi:ketoacyl-ACP synthase III [uncultured Bacteroides sp.]|uniref:3-oxoacyl-ACP synthase III family protein n=1 Tax=uncultured Bacteroides sp. TaxID=162156 RepID=UPI0032B2D18F